MPFALPWAYYGRTNKIVTIRTPSKGRGIDLPRRKPKPRARSKRRKRSRPTRPKTARRKKTRKAEAEAHHSALLALLMFLYMLKLIDEKTLNKIYGALTPRARHKRRRTKVVTHQ